MSEPQRPILDYSGPSTVWRDETFGLAVRFAGGVFVAAVLWHVALMTVLGTGGLSLAFWVRDMLAGSSMLAIFAGAPLFGCLRLRRYLLSRLLLARPWFFWMFAAVAYVSGISAMLYHSILQQGSMIWMLIIPAWVFAYPCLAALWLARTPADSSA
jgi:hypothetical protein